MGVSYTSKDMNHPALPSPKETIILEILADGREHYGLEILAEAAGKLSKGGLYVTLSRMEDKKYLRGRKEDVGGSVARAPRRLYQITGEGRRALQALSLMRTLSLAPFAV